MSPANPPPLPSERSANRCPQCGAPVAPDSVGAPCPACLMQLGLAASDEEFLGGSHLSPVGPTHVPGAAEQIRMAGGRLPQPAELAALFPELQIIRLLGNGGMGAVYQARQTALDRLVAIKIIMPEVAGDPGFAERFAREARVLARLSHPHIVTIHDFGQRAGLHFLVMEFIDGVNLRQILNEGRMEAQESLRIIADVCEALEYAHEEGVIHRDIKPENILLDRKGRVKIADFGLARMAGREAENLTLTGTRQIVGTPRYMAPEQMQGARTVDHRADLYSLGVVFYEMLTGEVPIGRFPPPSRQAPMDARLDDVVLKALDSNPDHRYQRASQIKTDVEEISRTQHTPARYASREPHRRPTPEVNLPAVFQLIVGAVQLIVSTGIVLLTVNELSPPMRMIYAVLLVLGGAGALLGLNGMLGAVAYLAGGSVGWLRIGAIGLLLPTCITWIAGLPVGIWTLLVTSPHYRSADGSDELQRRGPLRFIAIAQLTLGFADFLLLPLAYWFFSSHAGGYGLGIPVGMVVVFLLTGIKSLCKIVTAIGALSGGSRKWNYAGAIVMLWPLGMLWILELLLAIWCLYLLGEKKSPTELGSNPGPDPLRPTQFDRHVPDAALSPRAGSSLVASAADQMPRPVAARDWAGRGTGLPGKSLPCAAFQLVASAFQLVGVLISVTFYLRASAAPAHPETLLLAVVTIAGLLATLTAVLGLAGAIHHLATHRTKPLRVGAMALLLPVSITWPLSLIAAVWTLNETKDVHDTPRLPLDEKQCRSRLAGLARLHITVGVLSVACLIGLSFIMVTVQQPVVSGREGSPRVPSDAQPVMAIGIICLISLAQHFAIIVSSAIYLATRRKGWLTLSTWLLLVPFSLFWWLSLPLALWTFTWLARTCPRGGPLQTDVQDGPWLNAAAPADAVAPTRESHGSASSASQLSAPWSGFGWAQQVVRQVPRRHRWNMGVVCLLLVLVTVWGLRQFSDGFLLNAARRGDGTTIRLSVMLGANLDAQDEHGMTPLTWAVWEKRTAAVRQLLAAGANIQLPGAGGETALQKAAYHGDTQIVDMLLQAGANPQTADQEGQTPLFVAAGRGHLEVAKTLLKHGADPLFKTAEGWTALGAAARHGHASIVKLLIPLGGVNTTDRRSETPLMKASGGGHDDIVALLLEAGADPKTASTNGETALTLAIAGGHSDIAEKLAEMTPGSANLVQFFKGFKAARAGQYNQAVTSLKEAAETLPGLHGKARMTFGDWYYELDSPRVLLWILIGECESRMGNREPAIAAFRKAAEQMPKEVSVVTLYVRKLEYPQESRRQKLQLERSEIERHAEEPSRGWEGIVSDEVQYRDGQSIRGESSNSMTRQIELLQ